MLGKSHHAIALHFQQMLNSLAFFTICTDDQYKAFDVIGIDEGQFFDDVRENESNTAVL